MCAGILRLVLVSRGFPRCKWEKPRWPPSASSLTSARCDHVRRATGTSRIGAVVRLSTLIRLNARFEWSDTYVTVRSMNHPGEPALAAARERQRTALFGLGAVYVSPPIDLHKGYDGWKGMFAVSDGVNDVLALACVPSWPGFDAESQIDAGAAAELLEGVGSRVNNELANRAAGLIALGRDEHGINLKRYSTGEDLARLLAHPG